jgi:AraC-like DNA-binding protein
MDNAMNLILKNRLRQMQVVHILTARSEWKPGTVIELSSSGHHCLVLPVAGSICLNTDELTVHAGPGRMFCVPPGSKYSFTVDTDGVFRCYWARFELDAGSAEFFKSLQLPLSAAVDKREQAEALFKRLISSSGHITDELRARAAILELIAAYLQNGLDEIATADAASEQSRFYELLDYIDQRPSENFSVEDLAGQLYLHPNYFIAYFRSLTGSTPIQYVNQRKMEHARRLLEHSSMPVQEIAREVGMASPYFSRIFKQMIGTSPRRYRQLMEDNHTFMMERPAAETTVKKAGEPLFPMLPSLNEEFGWLEDAAGFGRKARSYPLRARRNGKRSR